MELFDWSFDFEETSPPLMLEGKSEVSRVDGLSSLIFSALLNACFVCYEL